MNHEEKHLFKQLCSFLLEDFDKGLLPYASPEVLGQLFFNRMQAVAYGVLKNNNCLSLVSREFRNALQGAYEQNLRKHQSFLCCLKRLCGVLEGREKKYAILKGGVLGDMYPDGYRTSNDIDLLVRPRDVTAIGDSLAKAGFRQGNVRDGHFIPASRKEIIESKMLRGETVPYFLEIGLPYMHYLEVDINFSLDYKSSGTDAILDRMLNDSILNGDMYTLNQCDFFIHLCCHLHKEATTLPWITMKRDMTMYKYADIYMLLDKMSEADIFALFYRAEEYGLKKICAFAVLQTARLFDGRNEFAEKTAREALRDDPDFLHRVISPSEKKTYVYKTKNIAERFFMRDRVSDLKEVKTV